MHIDIPGTCECPLCWGWALSLGSLCCWPKKILTFEPLESGASVTKLLWLNKMDRNDIPLSQRPLKPNSPLEFLGVNPCYNNGSFRGPRNWFGAIGFWLSGIYCSWSIYHDIERIICLEPQGPLFLKVNRPQNKGLFKQNQDHLCVRGKHQIHLELRCAEKPSFLGAKMYVCFRELSVFHEVSTQGTEVHETNIMAPTRLPKGPQKRKAVFQLIPTLHFPVRTAVSFREGTH